MAMLSMRMWGAPTITNKTVLLIHGNREMGDAWWAVAEGLVKDGERASEIRETRLISLQATWDPSYPTDLC